MSRNTKALLRWMNRMMDKTGLCGAALCEALAEATGEAGEEAPSDDAMDKAREWEAEPNQVHEYIRSSGRWCMRLTRGCVQGKCQYIYNPSGAAELEATDE